MREGDLFFSNGYILADGGGGSEFYYRISVKEDGIVCEDIAWITDDKPMRYFIMDNEVTEQEYEAWIEENCKEIINFEHYEKEVIPMRSNDCPPGTPITFLPYNKR